MYLANNHHTQAVTIIAQYDGTLSTPMPPVLGIEDQFHPAQVAPQMCVPV